MKELRLNTAKDVMANSDPFRLSNVEVLFEAQFECSRDKDKSIRRKFLTKSKYLVGLQCPKCLWMRCNESEKIPEPNEALKNIFATGNKIGVLAQLLYPNGIALQEEDFSANIRETAEILKSSDRKPIFEAGITAGRLYARADILVPVEDDAWDLIEVKCSTGNDEKKLEVYFDDIAFQKYCYEQAGLKIRQCFLMHVNGDYVREGDIDADEYFTLLNVDHDVKKREPAIASIVEGFLNIIDMPQCPHIGIGPYCLKPYECALKSLCWDFLPEENVLEIARGKKKGFKLLDQGIEKIKDIPDGFKLSPMQQIQKICAIDENYYIDKDAIKKLLESLRYPLYFMDFETLFEAIPRFDGVSPYNQVPFQFSVHIQQEKDGPLGHYEFLAKYSQDPRKDFIEKLKNCMGKEGDVIVYNQSFEQSRLKELAERFPEYKEFCENVNLRMVDLYAPFRSFHYYNPSQKGSASIKKVLPALTGISYDDMEISNGGMAPAEFQRVTYGDNIEDEDRYRVYNALEEYCKLDTKAMVDIIDELRRLVN